MNISHRLTLLIGALVVLIALAACAPAQDASRSRSEYVAGYGATAAAQGYASEQDLRQGIMPADQIRVEEYLNYYEQNFPQPPPGYVIGLNTALGNTYIPASGGEVWLQIGLQAAKATEEDTRPLNVALVLDTSGSMSEADKMTYLKQSLHIFLGELHPEDIIAIVVYDSNADVLLPSQPVGDGRRVREAIDSLQPGGSTNLHGGLILGYKMVEEYFSPQHNNRVILLTDGNANQGVTDPDQIAADSLAYNQKGIYLSTIGLGLDFNDQLLSTLAEQGKGNYHFISDAAEMERIFKQEAAGLVQTVATKVWLTLELAGGAQVQRVYGYPYDLKGNLMKVQFDDAGAESNQILMVKMLVPAGEGVENILGKAMLDYEDDFAKEPAHQEIVLTYAYGAPTPYDPLVSPAVRRNATILKMAETLQQVSFLCDQRQYQQALSLVQEIKPLIWQISTQEKDPQLQEDVTLLTNYETTLQRLVELANRPVRPAPVQEFQPRPSQGPCIAALVMVGCVFLFPALLIRRKK